MQREVSKITTMAMNGEITFEEALKSRLEMVNVNVSDVVWLGRKYIDNVSLGAKDLVDYLKTRGVNVFIVSGGLRPAVEILADYLGIERNNVYAICLGKLREKLIPERDCLMRREDGKKQVLRQLKKIGKTAMVGDGMTDYNAGQFADLFIGFGGIVKRERVKKLAKIFVEEENLMSIRKHLI